MIECKVQGIISELGKVIIVFKGFSKNEISRENKYFSFDIDYYDKVNLKKLREQVIDEIIDNRNFDTNYKWMTMEEYQLFKEQASINKIPVVILKNNLYDKQFPYQGTLSNVASIYDSLYYKEDIELEIEQENLLKNISFFYGKIDYSKQSENYFVTYPEVESDIKIYKLYQEDSLKIDFSVESFEENAKKIELSDDEISFLDLQEEILDDRCGKSITIIISSDENILPNRYLERLYLLSNLKGINFYFSRLSIRRQAIKNEESYIKLLKEIYGYENYRELIFYKNVESSSKETINISQVQIIDDIVTQAEKAMKGESFRDIYITASTGAGKSVMFQIPALYLAQKYFKKKPLTLVISPLIGLMSDQVENLKRRGVSTSATINGNTLPFEKEKILEKIQNQEIDILYLSPETLQARSDIKMLIGNRDIGIVIIDEAHIVTTWGKSFRADYWYLGIYLTKLRKEYKFPIVTFTATAIYGGSEDMYLDTRNTLNMISPISYFGDVRRDDIIMKVRSSERNLDDEGRDYRKTKNVLALRHLKLALKNNQKSLLYFPTVKLLKDFYSFVAQNEPSVAEKIGKYYGNLQKEEKEEVLAEYKSGDLKFVIATKAFGMGIDIPDITNVYHYAPTGNVVDYIQEVGRAARDKSKVVHGFGIIDFLAKDMNEVKQLHGMSAIKKTQILEVMRKILSVYKEKGNNRNLIISPEDFKYIFVQNKRDEDSLDNKVKTVLLMIEKDFSSPNKLGYSPFVARPRSLFGNDLIFVTPELEQQFLKSRLAKFFSKKFNLESNIYSAIYQVNLSGIWEKYYKNISFPSFKFALFNSEERKELQHKNIFEKFAYTSGIEIIFNDNMTIENLLSQYKIILKSFEDFLNNQKISGNQFTVIDLGNHFMKDLKMSDKFEARSFAQTIINSVFEFIKITNSRFIAERTNSNIDNQRYIINQDSDVFSKFIMNTIINTIKPNNNYMSDKRKVTSFYFKFQNDEIDACIAALGIGEARKMLTYQVIGGNNPQIYLRMNSIYPLEKAVEKGEFYKNNILQDVQFKHYTSVEMLKFLFTKKILKTSEYSKWFWDNIEEYFMGNLPSEVKDTLSKKFKD